ncbi:MAG: hypothetical protein ACI8UO_005638 [Verrucomicrobiales bacterium]|jgi:hypothetical protein
MKVKSKVVASAVLVPVFLSLMLNLASAKRIPPPEVQPIEVSGVVYSVPPFSTDDNGNSLIGGVVEARDSQAKKLLYRVVIYKTKYDSNLETDVQDVFIKTLTHDKIHDLLILSDEDDRVYVLSLSTRKVSKIR